MGKRIFGMAADSVSMLMLYIKLANLLVSAYLIKELLSVAVFHKGSFSKTMKFMLAAVLIFFASELTQVLRVVSGPDAELIQNAFTFAFLLLLLSATIEIQRSIRAHEHLVKQRHKGRIADVE